MPRALSVSVALVLLGLAGCGSMANTFTMKPEEGGKRIYGGVRADCEVASDCLGNRDVGAARLPLLLQAYADMPFSLVGDTLALPITVPATLMREPKASPQRDVNSE